MYETKLPQMSRIRQIKAAPVLESISDQIRNQVNLMNLPTLQGARIAITAGSRGISNIPVILKSLVEELRLQGAQPFIVPAMGSHGGATALGQIEVLKSIGITSETIGVPIESSMEVIEVGKTLSGIPVYIDKNAAQADGIIVVNRVKAHTEFNGEIESGLYKMMVIGLGKHKGASTAHSYALRNGYAQVFRAIGDVVLEKMPILFGLAILENCYDQTAEIHAVQASDFHEQEKRLLEKAKTLMMRLPVKDLDLLIIDKIGKRFSGSGMDTNVVGRIMVYGQKEYPEPNIVRILTLDLDEESHGNATGIGISDFTTKRLADKIDWQSTMINCLTACTPEKARLPLAFASDKEAVAAALLSIGLEDTSRAKVIHICDTLDLSEMEVSEALIPELQSSEAIRQLTSVAPMQFDKHDLLVPI